MIRELNDSEMEIVAGGHQGCRPRRERPEVENKVKVENSFNGDSFQAGGNITIDIGNVG